MQDSCSAVLRAFIAHNLVHRGRIAPVGDADEVVADQLVAKGYLAPASTMPSGTRWFEITEAGRNVALVGTVAL